MYCRRKRFYSSGFLQSGTVMDVTKNCVVHLEEGGFQGSVRIHRNVKYGEEHSANVFHRRYARH